MQTKILFFFALIIPGEMWKIKSKYHNMMILNLIFYAMDAWTVPGPLVRLTGIPKFADGHRKLVLFRNGTKYEYCTCRKFQSRLETSICRCWFWRCTFWKWRNQFRKPPLKIKLKWPFWLYPCPSPEQTSKPNVRNMAFVKKSQNRQRIWLLNRNRNFLISKYKNIVRLRNPTYRK